VAASPRHSRQSAWGASHAALTSITLCYPSGLSWCAWCLDVFVAMVEGHAAGRQAGGMPGGTLRNISFGGIDLANRDMRTVTREEPPLPSLPSPPPTLHALTRVVGLTADHQELAQRGWQLPALEQVEQEGSSSRPLGQFMSSSRSLRRETCLPESLIVLFGRGTCTDAGYDQL